jgi:hypothetical protein
MIGDSVSQKSQVRSAFLRCGLEPGIHEIGGREASGTIQTLPRCRDNSAARYLRIASQ